MTELNEIEIFIPATKPGDAEREHFLAEASSLVEEGFPVRVYARGEDDWAFEQCDPVREILEINGDDALPITLLGPDIMGMYAYPPKSKMMRLSQTPRFTPKQATNSCASPTGQGGADASPAPRTASPLSQLLRQTPPEPKGPDMGGRWNLMGGDTGQGLPPRSSDSAPHTEG